MTSYHKLKAAPATVRTFRRASGTTHTAIPDSHMIDDMTPSALPGAPTEAASWFPEIAAGDPAAIAGALRRGLPAERFDQLRSLLGVSSAELSDVVGIAPSTLSRRRKRGHFDKDESERLLRIARLAAQAAEVLESQESMQAWMRQPARALGGETPLRFADTEPGAREVERLLIRLDRGVYS